MEILEPGEYFTRPNKTISKCLARIDQDPTNPLYCIQQPAGPPLQQNGGKGTKPHISWLTHYEIDKLIGGFKKVVPDFDLWETVEAGDLLMAKSGGNEDYMDSQYKVLARVGDVVMISYTPDAPEKKEHITKLKDQLAELEESDEPIAKAVGHLGTQTLKNVRYTSTTMAFKSAQSIWIPVRDLALFNWELIRE